MQMTSTEVITIAVTGIGTITIPLIIFLWSNRIAASKDLDQKHEENRRKFNVLLYDRENHPPHSHVRPAPGAPLTFEGIHFAPKDGERE